MCFLKNKIPVLLEKPISDNINSAKKIINSASERAQRCVEIASGAPLTEQEINATKKSEINTECPSIANPNYKAYAVE